MALIKDILTEFGVSVSYHKIVGMNIDWLDRYANVQVGSFVNEDIRRQNRRPARLQSFYYEGETFPFTADGPILTEGYLVIKQEPMFIDAEDDL
jgi:hypothetical protein